MECQPSGPTSSEKAVARTSTRLDYEFTKSFLESAEQKFYNLSGTSPIGKTFVGGIQSVENFTLAAFGEVAGGAVGILKSVVRPIDKVFQKRKRFIAVNVIGSESSESFQHSFRQIFIQLGVHVYYAYERQLNNIFLEADNGSGSTPGSEKHSKNNRNNSKKIMEDQLQAIQVLGWYAGSTCFYYMIAARTKENLLKALTLNKYSTKVASLWKARTREKLYYYHHKDKDWDFHHPGSKNVTRQDPKSGSVSVSVPLTPTPPIQLGKKCYVSAHEFFFKTSPVQVNFRDVISNVGQICTYLVKDESYNFGQTLMANIKEINQRNQEETQLHKENHFNIQEVQKEIAETKQLTKKTSETLEEIVEKIETILQNTSGGINSSVSKEDQGQSTNANENQNQMVPTKIRFNVCDPVDSFTGREDFLKSLHAAIKNTRHAQANNDEDSRSRATVTTVVSGIEGIGKTEAVRMYTYRYGWYYDRIIWIDGKNRFTIENSFRTLATDHLKIYPKTNAADTGDFEKLDEIAVFFQQVMKTLCKKSLLLLIFDNVQENNVEMVQQFLRHSSGESTYLVKPTVIVTSPVSNWGQRDNRVFNMGMLSEDESVAFTLKQLSIDSTYENRKEALELGKLLHHFPPALQLAVGLIREQSKLELFLPKQKIPIYGVQHLIDDYKFQEKKLLRLIEESGGSRNGNAFTIMMMVQCNVALDMLKRVKNGENVVKLLNTMALLRPSSDIRKEFLAALFLDEDEDGDFHGALELLCDYSLVTKSSHYFSIHPLIQKGTISSNISKEQSPGVLIGLTEKLKRFWHNVISPSSPIYENFLETTLHVTNCVFEKLLALTEFSREKEQRKMLEFMKFVDENVEEIRLCEDGNVFERIMSHSDSTEISSEFHRKRRRYKSRLPLPFPEPYPLPVKDKAGNNNNSNYDDEEDDDDLPKYTDTEVLWGDEELDSSDSDGFFANWHQQLVNTMELKAKSGRHEFVPTTVKKEEKHFFSDLVKEIEQILGLGSNKESKKAALKLIQGILASNMENTQGVQGPTSSSPSMLAGQKSQIM